MLDRPRQLALKPLASTDRGERAAFAALLAAAAHEPEAALGLACAYEALPKDARRGIVQAVVRDGRVNGLACSPVLAWLLAVESDATLALRIAQVMQLDGGRGLESDLPRKALGAGDHQRGAVLVLRPLHAQFSEASGLVWESSRGITQVLFEPLLHSDRVRELVRRLPWGLEFRPLPYQDALDCAAHALWAHRRAHGALPAGLQRLADLL